MKNIQIAKNQTKRSVQSLIQDSSIDYEFNLQAHELRKAFNATIRDLNMKLKEKERQVIKLQLLSDQKDQVIQDQNMRLGSLEHELRNTGSHESQLQILNGQLKKRLAHVQYRLQIMDKNRNQIHEEEDDENILTKQQIKKIQAQTRKDVCSDIQRINSQKIAKFTKKLKTYPMSLELEQTLQGFLTDILYVNTNSILANRIFQFKTQEQRSLSRKAGKISEKKNQKLSSLSQWKKLQKSLEKLHQTSQSPHGAKKSKVKNPYEEKSRPQLYYHN